MEFSITVRGERIPLTAEQEEMALAWCKKLGTDYVEDSIFCRNFFRDFGKKLKIKGKLNSEDVNFGQVVAWVNQEREKKLHLTKEKKKHLAQHRKSLREENKEIYGYAEVDGERLEIANYIAEPSGIFMGRGKHPRRGSWKKGPKYSDIILNLSPDAPTPKGDWRERVWEPNSLWIAKWKDRLTGKIKYVWLADSAPVKQERDKIKYEKAMSLQDYLPQVRAYINNSLNDTDEKIRQTATVAALIDLMAFRVGDEKDEDEADTVGASTLRGEHVKILSETSVEFDFLGKDSVRYHKEVTLPELVVENIQKSITKAGKKKFLFPLVNSQVMSEFLGGVCEGLTAKVFRTYQASQVVKDYLRKKKIQKNDPDYSKRLTAKLANLQAAKICNHMKKVPKGYRNSIERKRLRLSQLKQKKVEKEEQLEQVKIMKPSKPLKTEKQKKTFTQRKRKKTKQLRKQIKTARERIQKLNARISESKSTRKYNLNTSLKNYIDPRIYYDWGKDIDYDWRNIYSKALQKKFEWVEKE
jgi:DNA topoisomerase-1